MTYTSSLHLVVVTAHLATGRIQSWGVCLFVYSFISSLVDSSCCFLFVCCFCFLWFLFVFSSSFGIVLKDLFVLFQLPLYI